MCGEQVEVDRNTSLSADLGLDSLDMVELIVLMEDHGAPVSDATVPLLATVGDLYDHYSACLAESVAAASIEMACAADGCPLPCP